MNGAVRSVLKLGHDPSRPWRGIKADVWDGGHRMPFLARWPRHIAAGQTSTETICHTDLMATLAAILGATLPEDAGEDSYNVLPALLGAKLDAPIREATVHHSIRGLFAIRQGRWKLVAGLGSGGWTKPAGGKPRPGGPRGQLYDMATDPKENHNLWLERPDVVKRLTALLDRYKREGRSAPRS
jgi:arylsulfatase A-like enzyme